MPRGSYLFADGRVEGFSCAPGPAGWRYVSDRLDVACDQEFRPVRFRWGAIVGGATRLADGSAVIEAADPTVGRERMLDAEFLLTDSPGSWVAAIRQVARPGTTPAGRAGSAITSRPAAALPGLADLRLARIEIVRTATELVAGEIADLLLETWEVHRDDGTPVTVHLAGDVVLAATGGEFAEVEVVELDGPPTGVTGLWPGQG